MKAEIKKELDKIMNKMIKKHGVASPVERGVSHTLTYEDFIKWMTGEHPEVVLMPIQHEYARFRFGKNFKTGTYSWPIRAGKTTILKLIYQFTAECG